MLALQKTLCISTSVHCINNTLARYAICLACFYSFLYIYGGDKTFVAVLINNRLIMHVKSMLIYQ